MGSRELGLPMRLASPVAEGLPPSVTIWEVGPRDGLQNEPNVLPTEVKIEFVRRLAAARLPVVETTSFVHPEWIPQLADASAVLAGLTRAEGVRYPVLVPNSRGLDRALEAGVRDIAVFASATETFSRRNLNRGLDEQFVQFDPVVRRAVGAGLSVRGYISMAFGDPWEGPVAVEQVVSVAQRLFDMGCGQLSIGDTIGVATPGHVETLLRTFTGIPMPSLAVHFHDTYGQALANTYAALRLGVSTVDASAGGLGGCPYAHSATGNLATEDLVWMLDGLGIEHGVDLDALLDTSRWMSEKLGKPSASRVVKALGG
jgi:hydroxymethylglutaryl-CoA lyase